MRLRLRPWRDEDATQLYLYAREPKVADACGWLAHKDEGYSRAVIRTVLKHEGTFAITLKNSRDLPIGSIGIRTGSNPANGVPEDGGEIGYWLGMPFWNNGYATEALACMTDYGFREKALSQIICTYHDGNLRSARVMEKCGFIYHHTVEEHYNPMLHRAYRVHFMEITKDRWKMLTYNQAGLS